MDPGNPKFNKVEKSDKQILWEKQIAFLSDIEKEDLPIDNESLKETIAALNLNGIHTIASNAGHAVEERGNGDTPFPWILISAPPDQPGKRFPSEEWGRKNGLLLHAKAEAFLVEFYKNRQTDEDIKLRVGNLFDGQFPLLNIDETIDTRLAKGELLTEEEKIDLVAKLPKRQKEMEDFGQFLKSKFFAK